MTSRIKLYFCLFSALCLTACLVPEKFTASFQVKPDGDYIYKYDGTAVHYLAAYSIKQVGSLTPKEEAGLKVDADKMAKADESIMRKMISVK